MVWLSSRNFFSGGGANSMVMLIFPLVSDQISRGRGKLLGGAPAPCERKPVVGIAEKNHSYCSNHMTSSLLQLIIIGGGGGGGVHVRLLLYKTEMSVYHWNMHKIVFRPQICVSDCIITVTLM